MSHPQVSSEELRWMLRGGAMASIAAGIFLNHDPRRCWMVFWHCYHDTAGTEIDERVLVTVGVMSTAAKWRRFERKWNAVLATYGVSQFHTKDFAHYRKDYDHGCWRIPRRREAFLQCLIAVIKRETHISFISVALLEDYREVDQKYEFTEEYGGPYSITQANNMLRGTNWLVEKKDPNDRVEHFIEKGDRGQARFREHAHQLVIGDPCIIPKKDPNTKRLHVPFQAADLIGYEVRLLYDRQIGRGETRLRGAMEEVQRMLPVRVAYASKRDMIRTCEHFGVPHRPPAPKLSVFQQVMKWWRR